ncbi:formyltetrahydrofolate-dependent phosphoribosylglycinamide formyltransferase [Tistlia consotensis]|uniref:Phosphoribosylglycinamide formyltransferase n=1 Tax=Tistlia consotensis USBA 355 TaxID=560819 RepID=A0A1Y6CYJ3_9PROT|nr:phosphoribosylglycinamide formyltransferase [Tistlia consotensis]SMF83284.1 formyltetrahydrofolate-dependent phosphoribosylglycinamide formyltransferase [Tistlia consotensis USBA 355]SNS32458.1 formyltetrahydrofolate-dependent phosphoribosylglycinamide formyltransferase [Tistlia consotensis]
MSRTRVGVMISGRGSNLQALLDAAARPDYPAEIALVLSNVAGVQGLARAKAAGVPTAVVPHRDFADRESFEREVTARLEAAGCTLVAQAGFMRVVTPWFVAHWRDRLINIHPSLLPAFPGLHTHERALQAGVRLHGCTVHFVRDEVDQGPIIGQAAVPVLPGDHPDDLSARVLTAEHLLYPRCLTLVAAGRTRIEAERVIHDAGAAPDARLIVPGESA